MKCVKKFLCGFLSVAVVFCTGCSMAVNKSTDSSNNILALAPKPMAVNDIIRNPYMASSECAVHNDSYSSDITDAVLPLGIDSQLSTSFETQNPMAPSAAFYDENNNAIMPFCGGVAITDVSGDVIKRKGVFVPSQHDDSNYVVQISYSFVDSDNNIVMPTSHGHIIIVQTMDEKGEILPVFKKILDVDVSSQAKKVLGEDIDPNLLSVVYDYSGNLWFVTGGFRIYPDRSADGFLGYLFSDYIEKTMNRQKAPAEDSLYFYRLADGEGAENGISSNEDGAVILTNKSCYMLNADNGVKVNWKVDYESNGANMANKDSEYTGEGLAWGSGTTPTLTKELVLFTDNLDPVNLIAVSSKTGDVVAKTPVLDTLGDDVPVSVENSILVYSAGDGRTSVLVCNWYGAGNSGLSDPEADSSVQSYDNIYDANWTKKGNKYIAPGVERVDIVENNGEYIVEKQWTRGDIRDTSMIKLSTATGYLYGYWQDIDNDMWLYAVLDFETGETVLEKNVSKLAEYNNMAVGMIPDVHGNALYCPTNNMEMVCWQDSFVTLPDSPARIIDPDNMERYHITDDDFKDMSGTDLAPATYCMKVSIDNLSQKSAVSFKVNGLDKKPSEYTLFYEDSNGKFKKIDEDWSICDADGKEADKKFQLDMNTIYEIRFEIADNTDIDLDRNEKNVKVSVILAKN